MAKLKKILCVEDDLDIQEITEFALSDIGELDVSFCSSGVEALEKVESIRPDLILLDVMMPLMDGPTMLKKLRGEKGLTQIPVVMMTAKVQGHEVEEYKALGAEKVISKPFNPLTLAEELTEIWEGLDGQS